MMMNIHHISMCVYTWIYNKYHITYNMADSLFVVPVDFDPTLDEVYNEILWGKPSTNQIPIE
jgi:hypothetical protein